MSIGVPIKVLHEAEGHIITCETITGEVYRGKLIEAEDNMNCQMTAVTVTYRDGRVAQLENIYIRGSKIRYFPHKSELTKNSLFEILIFDKIHIFKISIFTKFTISNSHFFTKFTYFRHQIQGNFWIKSWFLP